MQVFDLYAEKYDRWYNEPLGRSIFEAEVDCLKSLEPPSGRLLEVGVGSGRFAKALGISYGVDISRKLLRIAMGRGVKGVVAKAESLPFKDGVFDGVFMLASLCFFQYPIDALLEARRVLKKDGYLVLGLLLKDSPWAEFYMQKAKEGHPIYRLASFYSFEETKAMLELAGFEIGEVFTTLLEKPREKGPIENKRTIKGFYKDGGFHCIKAKPL